MLGLRIPVRHPFWKGDIPPEFVCLTNESDCDLPISESKINDFISFGHFEVGICTY